jgi:regulator of replication initiation timing
MSNNAHDQRLHNFQEILNDRIELISQLKDRIIETETDNDSLAVENEELRQFSLDGYAIAKNVKTLSSERECLSVDLSDKANTIRKLLDQNEAM